MTKPGLNGRTIETSRQVTGDRRRTGTLLVTVHNNGLIEYRRKGSRESVAFDAGADFERRIQNEAAARANFNTRPRITDRLAAMRRAQ
jgi:hypothetical protein